MPWYLLQIVKLFLVLHINDKKEIACKSVLVKGIVDDSGADDEIPLPQIKKAILVKIIEYCTYINTN